jgi:hypothetical protein
MFNCLPFFSMDRASAIPAWQKRVLIWMRSGSDMPVMHKVFMKYCSFSGMFSGAGFPF